MSGALTTNGSHLADLAGRINDEHDAAARSISRALEHARTAGGLLIEAKSKLPFGAWLPWLETNCGFSRRTASNYMRLSREWPELGKRAAQVADLSLRKAIEILAPKKASGEIAAPKQPPTIITAPAREIGGKAEPRSLGGEALAPRFANLRREPTAEEQAEHRTREDLADRLSKTIQAWHREHPNATSGLICDALGDVIERIQDGAEGIG